MGAYRSGPDNAFVPDGTAYTRTTYGTYFPCKNSVATDDGDEVTPPTAGFSPCYPRSTGQDFKDMLAGLRYDFRPSYGAAGVGIEYTPDRPQNGWDVAIIILDAQVPSRLPCVCFRPLFPAAWHTPCACRGCLRSPVRPVAQSPRSWPNL